MSEPTSTGQPGPGRWAAYLDWLREDVILAVLRLSRQEQRTARVPSGWSPLELLNHLLHMEQRWFVWGFLAEPVAEPWGDWDVADPGRAPSGVAPAWRVPEGVTAEDLAERLRAVGRRTTEIVADHALAERARVGGRFAADPPTLEWICFHVLTEYARHAGHLDVVVEIGGG
ncbi:DUF664 domain-containing protein [Nocardioides caeni]|uniref:DUF664 domain-containing protein n=1 Tax=Nocardioides caeni TaxID=574700 RepID=A0A4S8N2B9_9ACTN|nr:DUF664 domain-containing protein [Nocardioides caeni]THV10078.1 DUF664 domain-containing protein [Nocardioides caeni]